MYINKIIQNTVNSGTHITKTPIQLSKTPTHYKTHTCTYPHIRKATHTHTHGLQNELILFCYKAKIRATSHPI